MTLISRASLDKAIKVALLSSYGLIQGCGNTSFSGGGAGFISKPPIVPPKLNELSDYKLAAAFTYSIAGSTYILRGDFLPKDPRKASSDTSETEFILVPGSLKAEPGKDFPPDLASTLYKASISAFVSKSYGEKPWNVSFKVATSDLVIEQKNIGSKTFDLKSSSADQSWSEKTGEVAASAQTDNSSSDCKIGDAGATLAGYYTVVTTKAPCDFRLPTIKVGLAAGLLGEVEIGTYWNATARTIVAHQFPFISKIEDMPKVPNTQNPLTMDNGFILVEPTGKTYLLADAGLARNASNHQSTEDIAKTILAQKFPGVAFQGLLKPVAGSKANNYAESTVFQKGSIIALYDDTPDMSGKVDVSALTSALRTSGLSLEWLAQLVKK